MEINGKKVIVIGGASGMGRASAELLHARGATRRNFRPRRLGRQRGRGRHRRRLLSGRRDRLRRHRGDPEDRRREARWPARHRDHGRWWHRQAHHIENRPARSRVLPVDHRSQPDRHLQHQPAGGAPDEPERAGGRRARRHHQHRLDRGVRRPDRSGRLHRRQSRHRRHVPDHGARPRARWASACWRSRRACSPPG